MASLRLTIFMDSLDSKKSNFSTNPLLHVPNYSSVSIFTSLGRLIRVRVCRTETELSQTDVVLSTVRRSSVNDGKNCNLIEKDPGFGLQKRKKYRGGKKDGKREMGFESFRKRSRGERERFVLSSCGNSGLSVDCCDLSLDQCCGVLRKLEKCGRDSEALELFEWMRSNGKARNSLNAYNVILRVLGRREGWGYAERLIREAGESFGAELDCRVFNTLIYSCAKKGHVNLGGKWFRMMLEMGISPNIATFGMLMGLYQKGWNVEEAEFVFVQMRRFRIICHSAYSAMITINTRLRLYDKAEEVSALMREDKVVLNLENWLVLLNTYSQQGRIDEAEGVFLSMQQAGFPPNIVAYNTLITGYGRVANMVSAQRLFMRIQNEGLQPDETTYRSMIEGWGRAGNHKEAEWYYMELKRIGFKPNSSNLYTLINLQAEFGDEDGATKILDDMLKMGCQYSSILGTLLKAYERAGMVSKVPRLLKGSFYRHILINQNSCSILIMAYVKHGLVDDAIRILQEKEWKDQGFEDNLYHLLICSCKELGHLDNAVKIYNQIADSPRPNLHISCTMIDVYSIMGLVTKGEEIYFKLESCGIVLDVIAFSVVVRMYSKAGSLKDACNVLETMEKQKDIFPDVYLYRDMLRIYQRCGMTSKLKDLYYKILGSGIVWDRELYNCIINCCARALPVDELSRLFNEMFQQGFTPNTITFNVMLDAYGKSRLFKKAKELFLMAKKQGLVDVISYNTIIAAYGREKDLKNMAATVQTMQFDGFSVSIEAYNCMLDAYGKEGQMERFKYVLQKMKEVSCNSDHYTYNIMINIYGEQGCIDEVVEVLTELQECGLGPDLCSYNTLIKAYGIAGMVEEAVNLVKEMREHGIEPDKITYGNLITALRNNDKFLEAVKWSLWMKQMGM